MHTTERRNGAALLLRVGLLALTTAAAASAQGESYVRANEGAQIRVFQDMNAKSVGEMAAGDLLRVHSSDTFDLADGRHLVWHEVSSPNGFPVWVYGQYLASTGAKDVYAVTGNAVRMRPMPESSLSSYPLRTTLRAGERVLLIERKDPNAPLATDWVHVWSPPSARAWIFADETTAVTDVATARAAWAQGMRVLPNSPAKPAAGASGTKADVGGGSAAANTPVAPVQNASAGGKVPDEAYRSLAYGDTLLENARKKGRRATEADFAPALRAYDVVLDMAPAGSQVAQKANRQKELGLMLQEVAALRGDVTESDARNKKKLRDLQDDQYKQQLEDSATWGRFTGRGWVESVTKGKQTRYYLRWAGDIVYEIDCGSGRYALKMFDGYQIGVIGSMVRAATASTQLQVGQVAMLDVSRIEVIDGGGDR